jgi:Protein of unknown function (DUF1702)
VLRRWLAQAGVQAGTPWLFHAGGDVAILQPIFRAFARGIGCGVEGVSSDGLQRQQERVEWDRRPFFREGYGFGLCAAEAMTRGGNPDVRTRGGAAYRMMQYTGYGFWNGFAATLGLRRISEDAAAWADVADYPQLHPFIVGGRSFAGVARAARVTRELLESFEHEATPTLTAAAWHGCGRGLWFRAAAAPDALVGLLTTYPPATTALTLGLGVAMSFTQIASPAAVVRSIESMPERFHEHLRRGASIALAAMVHDDPGEERRIRSLHAATLGSYLDDTMAATEHLAVDRDWYGAFVDRLVPVHVPAQ